MTLDEALNSGRGVERPFQCEEHADSNASASVNVDKGVWVCYACGARGTINGHVPSPEAAIRILAGDEDPRVYPELWLDIFDAYEPSQYWADRYGYDVAALNRCGTDARTGDPTYPMRGPHGEVWGVVRRQADSQPKYVYPDGVSVSRTVYGNLDRKPVCVLVEGASDVMALEESGIPDHWSVWGCYGAGLKLPQIELLAERSPKLVVIAFDDDDAGHKATDRASDALEDIAPFVWHQWGKVGVKDAGELRKDQRVAAIRSSLNDNGYAKYL